MNDRPGDSQAPAPAPRAASGGLLAGYEARAGLFDELLEGGRPRAQYRPLLGELAAAGPTELRRRWEMGGRLLRESGVTYNVYGDPLGTDRPWQLDPLPFVIPADEWAELERGLVQRATLLNAILADAYGPQRLLREGRLPAPLILGHPGFLRPCHGWTPPGGIHLHLYAADLARAPDGRWWVLSDRTQVPTGPGYALENRLVVSRLLPRAFRASQVVRLAAFFNELRDSLAALAPRVASPRVVVLTPGPSNETYFEHVCLARYLGYSLVEGEDLLVRDDRVVLKTLGGLEPVHVILRRVDDDFCDPLELRNESLLGVPGLMQAARAGHVAVANALGSGLAQGAALMGFLPGLSRDLLGEELRLPSVATWWCGQNDPLNYVLENVGRLVVKPAWPRADVPVIFGERLGAAERAALRDRIRFQPHLYLAQEEVELSAAPSWDGTGLGPRPVAVRVFVVAAGGTYRVLPGGLTRVSASEKSHAVSMQRGGVSKDTWVLSTAPVEPTTRLQAPSRPEQLRRVGNNLPSRVASNLFWLGRYVERAEATARFLRTLLRLTTANGAAVPATAQPILDTLAAFGLTAPAREDDPRAGVAELGWSRFVFDPALPGSLRHIADQLRRLSLLVRDRLSSDMSRLLSSLGEPLTRPPAPGGPEMALALPLLNQLLVTLAAVNGLANENVTRAQSWRFLDLGHRLERALFLATLLDRALAAPDPHDTGLLDMLLEAGDSSITYRSRYNLVPHLAAVVDLLTLDDRNPRSLLFQFETMAAHFAQLPGAGQSALPGPAERLMLETLTRLRLADPTELSQATPRRSTMRGVLRDAAAALPRLSDQLALVYFAHATIARAGAGETPALPGAI
ncbi:MAG: circularly permuted type 2 ATP-grasp protein [Limisphaerales bacterium]